MVGGFGGCALCSFGGKMAEDTVFQMQVDINIRQKIKGGTINTNSSASRQASVSDGRRAGLLNSFGGELGNTQGGGRLSDNRTNYNEQIYTGEYSEKQTTL